MKADEEGAATVRPFAPGDAQAFHDLNMEWLTAFFHVEAKDEATLSDPEGAILAPGGHIPLADLAGRMIGCVALLPMSGDAHEVAKMAVAPEAQGRGVGRLYLESSARPAPPCIYTSRRASATCRRRSGPPQV